LSSFDTHFQADNLRGTNSKHISHGQNDIRQLNGVNVNVDVNADRNTVTVTGNLDGVVLTAPTVSWREQFIVSSANLSFTYTPSELLNATHLFLIFRL